MNIRGSHKFVVALDDDQYSELERIALERGITVQQLLRAAIIPEWMRMRVEFHGSREEVAETQRRRGGRKDAPV